MASQNLTVYETVYVLKVKVNSDGRLADIRINFASEETPTPRILFAWRKPTPIGSTLALLFKAATNRIGDGKEAENSL